MDNFTYIYIINTYIMIIKVGELQNFNNSGVYKIINNINGKFYLGSTIMTILKRIEHHYHCLINNKHKNKHLQNAWNKYGENAFSAEVVEITSKELTLISEQIWIDKYFKNNILYNINPLASGTPNLLPEVIARRAATMKKRYASGEIIPYFKGKTTWNKGLSKKDIDYSYLKVPKTITEKRIKSRIDISENRRNNTFPEVYIYDLNMNFISKFRCAKDIEEWSLTDLNNLPIKSRFYSERMGKPVKFLQTGNINKSCKTGKPYKGLFFFNKPLHQEIDVEKLDKNGEL